MELEGGCGEDVRCFGGKYIVIRLQAEQQAYSCLLG